MLALCGFYRRVGLFDCSLASLFRLRRGCFFLLPLPFTALLLFFEGYSGAALRFFINLSVVSVVRGLGLLTP